MLVDFYDPLEDHLLVLLFEAKDKPALPIVQILLAMRPRVRVLQFLKAELTLIERLVAALRHQQTRNHLSAKFALLLPPNWRVRQP